jgi:hypothetical protein
VVNLSTGQKLDFIRRTAINDVMQSDPDGEIIIDTSGGKVSGLIPVIAVDFGADPDDIELRNW